MREGLDVNTQIQYEPTQEFKQQAVELAKNQIAVLSMAIEALATRCETLKAEQAIMVTTAQQAVESRDLLAEHYQNVVREQGTKIVECYDCRSVLWKQREKLYKITGWHE